MVDILKRTGWNVVKTCDNCESKLKVYSEDVMKMLKHDADGNTLGLIYWFNCPVCRNLVYLDYEKDNLERRLK